MVCSPSLVGVVAVAETDFGFTGSVERLLAIVDQFQQQADLLPPIHLTAKAAVNLRVIIQTKGHQVRVGTQDFVEATAEQGAVKHGGESIAGAPRSSHASPAGVELHTPRAPRT